MNPLLTLITSRTSLMKRLLPVSVALLVVILTPARAAVIYSGIQNIAIPTGFTGIYLDLDTGITGTGETAGWDINPFFGGVGVANSPAFQPARSGTGTSDPILGLAVGATVNGARLFSTGYGGSQTHLGTQFTAGQEGYLGFKFTTNAASGPYYGWMRVVFTANTAGALIKDWAYENAGTAIVTARVVQSAASGGAQIVTLSPGTGESFTLGSVLTNTGGNINSLVKTGLGTTSLTAANTYTGGTTLSGGVLALGSGGALGTTGTIGFGGGTLQFSASNTSDYSARFSTAAAQTYRLDTNGQAVTLATALTSVGGTLTKSGAGTLTLTGVNSYAGTTTVNAGTLLLNKTATGALASTSALALGGGTFSILGKTGANATAQTMASLAVNTAGSSLVINPNGGTSTTLTITSNTVTGAAGGAVIFDTSAGTPSTALIAWNPTLTGGIIGGGFTIKDNGGTGFATVTAGKVIRYTAGTVLTASNPSSAATNFRTTAAGTITNTVVTPALNSLGIDTTSGASIWDLGGRTASITTGGLLMTGASNFTIQNGSIQSTSANHDFLVSQYGAGTLTISAAITGGATASLAKTGSGTLNLNGAQNYNTLTTSAGTTNVNGSFTGGTATVNANATMNFGASQTLAALNIGPGVEVTFGSGLPLALAFSGDVAASDLVPEPGTLGLLIVGALGVVGCRPKHP